MCNVFRRRAFTLVELLVVVGIIAILIALLLPALGRAREQANRVKCAANLRALGQALAMYTQQYGCYPAYFTSLPDGSGCCAIWPTRLRAFVGGDQDVFHCPSQDDRCRWVKGEQPGGPGEAAGPEQAAFGYAIGERLLLTNHVNERYFSYGYNHSGSAPGGAKGLGYFDGKSSVPLTAAPGERPLKASRVRRPSEMIAIADATVDKHSDFGINPMVPAWFPGTVHGGGANVLFCDGHVESIAQRDLVFLGSAKTSDEAARWTRIQRMWCYDQEPAHN
jgi:prepilin-type processing-associated H-X9-DG protein/prepilin-type N-terminal cleavage/methylation domain-containing protein